MKKEAKPLPQMSDLAGQTEDRVNKNYSQSNRKTVSYFGEPFNVEELEQARKIVCPAITQEAFFAVMGRRVPVV